MRPPFLQDAAFLADACAAPSRPDAARVWWLGQSGFLVHWNGQRVVLDPYLSDSLTTKYAGTGKPHVRLTGRVVDPGALTGINVITSSHNHTDHLDADTILPILRANPAARILVPEANRAFAAERLHLPPESLLTVDAGSARAIGPWTFHGIPAAHETVERDDAGRCRFLGLVVRFGPFTVYHSGDTVLHDALVPALCPFRIDLALLPINGANPERRVAGNLDAPEAARLARDMGARLAVPCHYGMFEFNTAAPEPFAEACHALGQPCRILRNGEGLDLVPSP